MVPSKSSPTTSVTKRCPHAAASAGSESETIHWPLQAGHVGQATAPSRRDVVAPENDEKIDAER